MEKILIAYFSLKGETIAPGMKIVNLEKGNTEVAAEYIKKAVGGDLFEIETVKTYIKDHMKMIYEAKEELEAGTRVEVKGYPDNLGEYGTVYLGFPNWWNTMPMPVVTFLEHFDWSGKRIIPFCTNEGSGLGNSIADMKKICIGADIDSGGSFIGSQVRNSEEKIITWAKSRL